MIREKEFVVLKSVYPPEVVMKTAYLFLEQAYIHLQEDSTSWIVHLTSKEDALPENIGQKFENALLAEAVREITYRKTSNLRNTILARAMASSVISHDDVLKETEAAQENQDDDDALSDILTDWFDKHGK